MLSYDDLSTVIESMSYNLKVKPHTVNTVCYTKRGYQGSYLYRHENVCIFAENYAISPTITHQIHINNSAFGP